MYANAPSIYPKVSREEETRPNFLKEDEMRLQRLKLEEERLRESRRLASVRHEEQAADVSGGVQRESDVEEAH